MTLTLTNLRSSADVREVQRLLRKTLQLGPNLVAVNVDSGLVELPTLTAEQSDAAQTALERAGFKVRQEPPTPVIDSVPATGATGTLPRGFAVVDTVFAKKLRSHHSRSFTATLKPNDGEEFTKNVPNVGDADLQVLDVRGLPRVGEKVTPRQLLIGIVAEASPTEATPEERLLRAIFGEKAGEVRDVSIRAPAWCNGRVAAADIVGETATVVVTWENELAVGDELSCNGEPWVVAKIEPCLTDIVGPAGALKVAKTSVAREVLHARFIGPYTDDLQQPVAGRDQFGGQQITVEQAAVLATAAPWALWELLTIKSDAVSERTVVFEALVRGVNPDVVPKPVVTPVRTPESTEGPPPAANDSFSFFDRPTSPDGFPGVRGQSNLALEFFLKGLMLDVGLMRESVGVARLDEAAVRGLSHGPVRSHETVDAAGETVRGALQCQIIFGPVKDYACQCGKYSRMRDRCIVCESCGVEVIQSRVRGERMAHIELHAPMMDFTGSPTTVIPVVPPDVRGDVEPLYARVVELNHQKSPGLQEAMNALFARLEQQANRVWADAVTTKRVDYSGIANLTCDPTLEPGWCRAPRGMLQELFRPRTYGILEQLGYAATIKSSKRMVDQDTPEARSAAREAFEGATALLCATDKAVARKLLAWDHPSIAVDVQTAKFLNSGAVIIHIPVTDEAACQLASMADAGASSRRAGWLGAAIESGTLVEVARRALNSAETDDLRDPLVRAVLGRTPKAPDPVALDEWRTHDLERRATIRAQEQTELDRTHFDSRKDSTLDELEISVHTAAALRRTDLRTVADLCKLTVPHLRELGLSPESIAELREVLSYMGLSLQPSTP